MAKRVNLSLYLTYTILCAVAYCVPAFFVFSKDRYQSTWLLFLGNSFFLISMLFGIININKKLNENGELRTLILSGVSLIVSSILTIGVLLAILFFGFNVSSIGSAHPNTVLKSAPSNTSIDGATNGLIFMLLVSGIFVNLLVGAFAAFIAAATAKQKQETAKGHKAAVANNVTN